MHTLFTFQTGWCPKACLCMCVYIYIYIFIYIYLYIYIYMCVCVCVCVFYSCIFERRHLKLAFLMYIYIHIYISIYIYIKLQIFTKKMFFNSWKRQEPCWFLLCVCKTKEQKWVKTLKIKTFYHFWPKPDPNFGPKFPTNEFF